MLMAPRGVRRSTRALREYLAMRERLEEEVMRKGILKVKDNLTRELVRRWRTKPVQQAIKDAEKIERMFYEEGKSVSQIAKELGTNREYVHLILTGFYKEKVRPAGRNKGMLVPPLKAFEITADYIQGKGFKRIREEKGVPLSAVEDVVGEYYLMAMEDRKGFLKEYERVMREAGYSEDVVKEKVEKLKKALEE